MSRPEISAPIPMEKMPRNSAQSSESRVVPSTIGDRHYSVDVGYENQQPAKKRCCSNTCCYIGIALGVFFTILVIGVVVYVIMVHESQCYRGCQRVCTAENQHDCTADCWKVCWRAEWSSCPQHGAKVCAYTLWDKSVVNIFGK